MDANVQHTLSALLHDRNGFVPRDLLIEEEVIAGGLEASSVTRVHMHFLDPRDRLRSFTCVAKQLQGSATREAAVYRHFLRGAKIKLAPEVFRIEEQHGGKALLLLEDLTGEDSWPWRRTDVTSSVLHKLASLHVSSLAPRRFPQWDYEHELQRSAISTLDQLEAMRGEPEWSSRLSAGLRATRRLVGSLKARRAALLRFGPYDCATLHGDVHPGNALLRYGTPGPEPVLIDWSRARTGSALEDVSSWLQSLGYWEPQARRRHDTLLNEYLRARGESGLSSDVRAAYWMAGASNALAGALRYHCWRASVADSLESRRAAVDCVRDWLRVITRADALSA